MASGLFYSHQFLLPGMLVLLPTFTLGSKYLLLAKKLISNTDTTNFDLSYIPVHKPLLELFIFWYLINAECTNTFSFSTTIFFFFFCICKKIRTLLCQAIAMKFIP